MQIKPWLLSIFSFQRFSIYKNEHRLTYRLLRYIILCSLGFAFLVTVVQSYSSYRVDFNPVEDSFRFIKNNYIADIAESCLLQDSKQLKILLLAALQLKDIEYIDVKSLKKEKGLIGFEGNPNIQKYIVKKYPIKYNLPSGKTLSLGSLTAKANLEGIYDRFWRRSLILLVTNILIAFFTTISILIIFQVVLVRYLNKLASFSKTLNLNKLNRTLVLSKNRLRPEKPDELDQVVIAFNDMLKRIRSDVDIIKRTEKELRKREQQYRTLVENMNDGLAVVDEDGILEYVNNKFCEILGYAREDLIGYPLKSFLNAAGQDIFEKQFVLRKNGKENDIYEASFIKKSGEKLYTIVSTTRISDANKQFKGSFGIITDISKRRHMEITLKKAFSEIKQLKDLLEVENSYLREQVEVKSNYRGIIGQSDAIKSVLVQVEQVSETDSTVLLLGETGTGKELIAQAIHNLSVRKTRPMVRVNCAALSSALVENELFGHEKGAYTGAFSKQPGRFEIADKSTIFLDEIGELPFELQGKLLHVLQSGEFQRIGSSKTIAVDVRVIAATNKDLVKAVKEGRFREDLYYRLSVFPVFIPPLRDRKEDIPLLVWSFINEFGKKMGKKIKTIPQKSMGVMLNYSWPGNIRELRNIVEHATIISNNEILNIELPGTYNSTEASQKAVYNLKEIEKNHIFNVLCRTKWRIKGKDGAATILGLNPSTLYSKMKKLGIERPNGE